MRRDRTKAQATNAVRLDVIAQALAAVSDDPKLVDNVFDVFRRLRVTYNEFAALDGRDNYPRVPEWHWKLRVARNADRTPNLFAVMREAA